MYRYNLHTTNEEPTYDNRENRISYDHGSSNLRYFSSLYNVDHMGKVLLLQNKTSYNQNFRCASHMRHIRLFKHMREPATVMQ